MLPRVIFACIDQLQLDNCLRVKERLKNLTWVGYFAVTEKKLYTNSYGDFRIIEEMNDIESEYVCIYADDEFTLRKMLYDMGFRQTIIDSTELELLDIFDAYDISRSYRKVETLLSPELAIIERRIASYNNLKRKYYHVLFDYEKWHSEEGKIKPIPEGKTPVWMIWFQGYDNAPELIKLCIERVRTILDERYQLIFLDEESIFDYLCIPVHIIEKRKKNIIGSAAFSDICRVMLLNRYGGVYIDSDIYFTADHLPEYITRKDFFVYSIYSNWRKYVEPRIASSWLICAKSGNRLLMAIEQLLISYWQKEMKLSDWMIIHQFFTMVSEVFPNEIDDVETIITWPSTVLREEINDEYNESRFRQICKIADAHILNHKSIYLKSTNEGRDTYYGFLLKENHIL